MKQKKSSKTTAADCNTNFQRHCNRPAAYLGIFEKETKCVENAFDSKKIIGGTLSPSATPSPVLINHVIRIVFTTRPRVLL